jgi:hypothetical protein
MEIRPGMPGVAMTHIAIVEVQSGKSADWMEKVGDEQYQAPRSRRSEERGHGHQREGPAQP